VRMVSQMFFLLKGELVELVGVDIIGQRRLWDNRVDDGFFCEGIIKVRGIIDGLHFGLVGRVYFFLREFVPVKCGKERVSFYVLDIVLRSKSLGRITVQQPNDKIFAGF